MTTNGEFATVRDATRDPRILVFGRLLGAANRLEYLLGRDLEETTGLDHSTFELLLVVGRAGPDGISVRDIAQARVLTSGGATRLVQRAIEKGFVRRRSSPADARIQLIDLTPLGERTLLDASAVHVRNVEAYLLDALPPEQVPLFEDAIRTLSRSASKALPVMP